MILISCNKDLLKDYKLEPEIKLCVSGFVSNDSIWVRLSKNMDIMFQWTNQIPDYYNSLPDSDAIIYVYENGVFFDKLKFVNDSMQGISVLDYQTNFIPGSSYYYSNKKTTEGKIYNIEVNLKGYDIITSSAYLPYKVPIIGFDTTCTNQIYAHYDNDDNYWGDTTIVYTDVAIDFTDPVHSVNYYKVGFKRYNWGNMYIGGMIYPSPLFKNNTKESGLMFGVFSDRYIQGKTTSLNYKIIGNTDSMTFCLHSINEDAYKFNLSTWKYDKAEAEFGEPETIYSNVSNGMGIFIGFSTTYFRIPKNE